MTFVAYIKDKFFMIVLQVSLAAASLWFLWITGYPGDLCALILICWALIGTVVTAAEFRRRKRYFSRMEALLAQMEDRYLLGELMPDSARLEDRLYREFIRLSNKSAIERIRAIDQEKKEYREFIESWVHEIKAPITAISLICENSQSLRGSQMGTQADPPGALPGRSKDELTRRIWLENKKTENLVDIALYYARAGEVYKDYLIRKTELSQVVSQVLAENKYELIQNGVQAEVDCPHPVYTDEKWIAFMLNQIIRNSVKYKRGGKERLMIHTEEKERCVWLSVKDDGVGIKKEELPRIFEKGFTGSNGRSGQGMKRATGMGLYLCKNLCGKLGIEIEARSEEGTGTEVILKFPVGNYHAREED